MSNPSFTTRTIGAGHITTVAYSPPYQQLPALFVIGDTEGQMTLLQHDDLTQSAQFVIQKDEDDGPYPIRAISWYRKSLYAVGAEARLGLSYQLKLKHDKYSAESKVQLHEFDHTITAAAAHLPRVLVAGDSSHVLVYGREGPQNEGHDIDLNLANVKANHCICHADFDSTGQYASLVVTNNTVHILDTESQLGEVVTIIDDLPLLSDAYPTLPRQDRQPQEQHRGNNDDIDFSTVPTCYFSGSFTYQFDPQIPKQFAQSKYAVPTQTGISIYRTSNWDHALTKFSKPTSQEQIVSCAFSHNNAILAVLNNKSQIHLYNVISLKPSLLTTITIPNPQSVPLTHLIWAQISNSQQGNVDIVVLGRDGLVIGCSNILPLEQPHPISHISTPTQLLEQINILLHSQPNNTSTTSKSMNDDSDDEIVIRAPNLPKKSTIDDDEAAGGIKRKATSQNVESFDLKSDEIKSPQKKHKTTNADGTLIKSSENKYKHINSNMDSDNDHSDDSDGEEDGSEEEEVSIRQKLQNYKLPQDSYINLEDIADAVKDDLDDHYTTLFRKNYATARATELQQPFMPTSTQPYILNETIGDEYTLLNASEHGTILSRFHDGNTTVAVSLHTPQKIQNFSLPFQETSYTMATMDQYGIALAAEQVIAGQSSSRRRKSNSSKIDKKNSLPAMIHYEAFDAEREARFTTDLPLGENVHCIALSKDLVAVATSKGYVRMYDLTGAELEIFSIPGRILTMTAKGPFLAVFYHDNAVPLADSHNVRMQFIHTETLHVLYENVVAISPMTRLTWAYISSTGLLYTGDSDKVIRLFSTSRGNSWKVVCELNRNISEKGFGYWPVYIDYVPDDSNPNKKADPKTSQNFLHRIFSYELYNRKEPLPKSPLPGLKSHKMQIPHSRFHASLPVPSGELEAQLKFEQSIRERLLWDELISTHGQQIPQRLNQQFDFPWVQLTVQLAGKGHTVNAIQAARQIRDIDMFTKTIEKLNSSNTPNIGVLLPELKEILAFKRQCKKLGLFPYQNPLPHVAMYKSKEITKTSAPPATIMFNPFASTVTTRSSSPTMPFPTEPTTPSPATTNAPSTTGVNPFQKTPLSPPQQQPAQNPQNPFRRAQ